MVHHLRRVLILISIIFMIGCSTYRVYDSYEIENGENKPSYKTTEAEASLRVKDEDRFFSFGILGLPVIPTFIKIKDNKTLTIESILGLNKEHEFFINTQPCLILDNVNKICASELIVDAMATYQDDGTMYRDGKKRWHMLPEFMYRTNLVVPSRGENRPGQVGQEEIYRHYDYKKQPAWERLQVRFIHNFECPEKCPDTFLLDANDFLNLSNQKIISNEYRYQKKRHHDYDFITSTY
jgi:hypothetical protein